MCPLRNPLFQTPFCLVLPMRFEPLASVARPVPCLLPPLSLPAQLARSLARGTQLCIFRVTGLRSVVIREGLGVRVGLKHTSTLTQGTQDGNPAASAPSHRSRATGQAQGCRCRAQEGPGPASGGGRGSRGWGGVLKGTPALSQYASSIRYRCSRHRFRTVRILALLFLQ